MGTRRFFYTYRFLQRHGYLGRVLVGLTVLTVPTLLSGHRANDNCSLPLSLPDANSCENHDTILTQMRDNRQRGRAAFTKITSMPYRSRRRVAAPGSTDAGRAERVDAETSPHHEMKSGLPPRSVQLRITRSARGIFL